MHLKWTIWALTLYITFFNSPAIKAVPEESFTQLINTDVAQYFTDNLSKSAVLQLSHKINAGERLRYFHRQNGHPNLLIISPGRSEVIEKYAELIFDLKEKQYDILVFDQLGQGLSQRYTEDSQVGHIETYDKYVAALKELLDQKAFANYQKKVLYGHSMGAVISHLFAAKNPHAVNKLILSAPSYQINLGVLNRPVAKGLLWAMKVAGMEKSYGPGLGPYKREKFEENTLTNSQVRFTEYRAELFNRHPDLALGGPSVNWIDRSIRIGEKLEKGEYKVSIPMVILQAEKDTVVINEGQDNVCPHQEQCRIIKIKDSKHEAFIENDMIRNSFLKHLKTELGKI